MLKIWNLQLPPNMRIYIYNRKYLITFMCVVDWFWPSPLLWKTRLKEIQLMSDAERTPTGYQPWAGLKPNTSSADMRARWSRKKWILQKTHVEFYVDALGIPKKKSWKVVGIQGKSWILDKVSISPTANSKSLRPTSSEDGEAMKCQAVAMKIAEKATCHQGMDSSKGSILINSKKQWNSHLFLTRCTSKII